MVIQRIYTYLLALTFCFFSAYAHANVTLEPQRTQFSINDTVELILEYKGDASNAPSGQPDVSALEDMFYISDQRTQRSSSSNIQISNGQTKRISETIYRIVMEVSAKKEGSQTIPSVSWGSFKTAPSDITVTPMANTSNAVQSNFFAEADITNTSPYVQEQMILTVKAYATERFGNGGFGLSFPDNVIAKLTGQNDKIYKTALNGQSYFVQERQFILYVERSGVTTLPPVTFTAQFPTNHVDSFGFRLSKNQRTRTQPIELTVRPIPNSAGSGAWLPAQSLSLSHYLEKDTYEVGTPMSLTLSTVAEGIISEQMPAPDLSALKKSFKVYPDQPETESRWDNGTVVSTRIDKIALIPINAGQQTIPSVSLNWWNTKKDTQETAKTPPIKITVNNSANDTPNTLPSLTDKTTSAVNNAAMMKKLAQLETDASGRVSKYWQYGALFFAALSVLLGAILVWLRFHPNPSKVTKPLQPTLSTADLLKQITPDAQRASKQVILWARGTIGSHINSVRDVIQYCNQSAAHKELAAALVQLNKCVYGENQTDWNPKALKNALKSFKPIPDELEDTPAFLKLYPDH